MNNINTIKLYHSDFVRRFNKKHKRCKLPVNTVVGYKTDLWTYPGLLNVWHIYNPEQLNNENRFYISDYPTKKVEHNDKEARAHTINNYTENTLHNTYYYRKQKNKDIEVEEEFRCLSSLDFYEVLLPHFEATFSKNCRIYLHWKEHNFSLCMPLKEDEVFTQYYEKILKERIANLSTNENIGKKIEELYPPDYIMSPEKHKESLLYFIEEIFPETDAMVIRAAFLDAMDNL